MIEPFLLFPNIADSEQYNSFITWHTQSFWQIEDLSDYMKKMRRFQKKRKLILGNSLKLKDKTKDTHARDRQSPEAATRGVLQKKLFLEISQNSQENTGARVSLLIKPATLLIRRL